MKTEFALLLSVVALAWLWPASVAAQPVPGDFSETSEARIAKANRANVVKQPVMTKSGKSSGFKIARAKGHHGRVEVSGILGVDGKLTEIGVVLSSKSTLLDQAAIDSARNGRFEPAYDRHGKPIAVWITLAFQTYGRYLPYQSDDNVIYYRSTYRCDEFLGETTWWRSVWPERAWNEHDFYQLTFGLKQRVMQRPLGIPDVDRFLADHEEHRKSWLRAMDACRLYPKSPLIAVWAPEGKMLETATTWQR
jgi:TonB family protein